MSNHQTIMFLETKHTQPKTTQHRIFILSIFLLGYFALFSNVLAQENRDIEAISGSLGDYDQKDKGYKNRISMNLLAIPAANLVMSYERGFKNQAIWLGYNYHFNGMFEEEDRNMSSIALEYRYYFFSKRRQKISDGFFAGVYSKYRTGREDKFAFEGSTVTPLSHSYNNFFAGLSTGYRYNYKRLALSAFVGYGFLISSSEEGEAEFEDFAGTEIQLNEDYKKDIRIGVTVGIAF